MKFLWGILIVFVFSMGFVLALPPSVTLHSPDDNFFSSSSSVDFNCSFSDPDYDLGNLSLFGNFSGVWQEVDRYEVGNLNHVFSETISEGNYVWACVAEDNSSEITFGENRSLVVDLTFPKINLFELNDSSVCGNKTLEAICNVSDNFGLSAVLLEVTKPSGAKNLTMDFVSGNYTEEVFVNETGDWSFRCFAEDYAGNINVTSSFDVLSYSGLPELYINSSKLVFDRQDYIEGEVVSLSAYVENIGCVDSSEFNVSFFRDEVSFGNQLGLNQSLVLNAFSGDFVNLSYLSYIGKNNIFVFLDSGDEINEHNESNNVANNSFSVTLWQEFYGNVSAVKILRTKNNFTYWTSDENVVGNIFVADMESIVDWLSLKALGRDIFGSVNLNDFSEVDNLFGTTNFEDSISNTYLDGGAVKSQEDFVVHKKNINNVPIINSTSSGNFVTGILWDSSDDTGDNEFSEGDKEDLVFVTKLNNGAVGEYGVYDYEITVPVELRSYDSSDSEEVYLYYDLV